VVERVRKQVKEILSEQGGGPVETVLLSSEELASSLPDRTEDAER